MTVQIGDKLRTVGQSLWLGQLSRRSIGDGSLLRYIEDCSVTGLSFSPQAISQAICDSHVYDSAIVKKLSEGLYGKSLTYSLIYEDVRYAADLLRAIHDRTDGADGWAVVPVSPLSISDNEKLTAVLGKIHERIHRPNALITLPALPDRLSLIEDLVFAGVPISIVNIYSDKQHLAISQAYLAGIERRIKAGRKAAASAFATINISRLESVLSEKTDSETATKLSLAIARKIYKTMRDLHRSQEWDRAYSLGARPLRLVWVSAEGTAQNDINLALFHNLIAPFSVISIPDESIDAFIDHDVPEGVMSVDGGDCDQVLADYRRDGLDVEAVAEELQAEYSDWLAREWIILLENIAKKSARIAQQENSIEQGEMA